MESAQDRITSQEFLNHLHAQVDEPWVDWSRGNPISPAKVAGLLRPFDIKPRKIRLGGDTARGYEFERCEDAFERYLPRDEDSNRNERNNGLNKPRSGPSEVEHEPEMFHSENPEKPLGQANVPPVPPCEVDTGENEPANGSDHAAARDLIWDFRYDDDKRRVA